jgi:hypothetical protein
MSLFFTCKHGENPEPVSEEKLEKKKQCQKVVKQPLSGGASVVGQQLMAGAVGSSGRSSSHCQEHYR